MTKEISIIDLFAAFAEKNHGKGRVLFAVESYVIAYDIFDNVRVIIDPSDDEIFDEFIDIDHYFYAIFEDGKLVESSDF